jgi:hypothetical protein
MDAQTIINLFARKELEEYARTIGLGHDYTLEGTTYSIEELRDYLKRASGVEDMRKIPLELYKKLKVNNAFTINRESYDGYGIYFTVDPKATIASEKMGDVTLYLDPNEDQKIVQINIAVPSDHYLSIQSRHHNWIEVTPTKLP